MPLVPALSYVIWSMPATMVSSVIFPSGGWPVAFSSGTGHGSPPAVTSLYEPRSAVASTSPRTPLAETVAGSPAGVAPEAFCAAAASPVAACAVPSVPVSFVVAPEFPAALTAFCVPLPACRAACPGAALALISPPLASMVCGVSLPPPQAARLVSRTSAAACRMGVAALRRAGLDFRIMGFLPGGCWRVSWTHSSPRHPFGACAGRYAGRCGIRVVPHGERNWRVRGQAMVPVLFRIFCNCLPRSVVTSRALRLPAVLMA